MVANLLCHQTVALQSAKIKGWFTTMTGIILLNCWFSKISYQVFINFSFSLAGFESMEYENDKILKYVDLFFLHKILYDINEANTLFFPLMIHISVSPFNNICKIQ